MNLYEAIEIICEDYCKYPDVESGNKLADICDKCPMNKCEELRWAGCKDKPTTQTETQNSNLTFEKRTMRDCYNCKKYETEGECIECHYEPKDEPMKTADYCDICKRDMCEDCIADATNPYCVPSHYEINYEPKDEPQMTCEFCQNHEQGDTLYEPSDWDGGIGFDYIRDIKYCPICGKKLNLEDEPEMEHGFSTKAMCSTKLF